MRAGIGASDVRRSIRVTKGKMAGLDNLGARHGTALFPDYDGPAPDALTRRHVHNALVRNANQVVRGSKHTNGNRCGSPAESAGSLRRGKYLRLATVVEAHRDTLDGLIVLEHGLKGSPLVEARLSTI